MLLTGHITKLGNNFLRRNMVDCARVAVRKDSNLREFYVRIRQKRGEKAPDSSGKEDGRVRVLDAEEG